MSATNTGSVTVWMEQLRSDDKAVKDEAARLIWEKYHRQIEGIIQKRLASSPRARIDRDADDVALSVFNRAFRAIERGDFPRVGSRDDLLQIFMLIARRSVIDLIRRAGSRKRGGDRVRDESSLKGPGEEGAGGLDALPAAVGDPAIAAAAAEDFDRLLDLLGDDSLREIALLRMDGYTAEAIAAVLGCSVRNVFNKLKLIRMKWEPEVD